MTQHLNYKSFGSGDTIIIMHGLLGMLDNWQSFAKKLSEGYRVLTLDLRNHGKSFHANQMTYELMSEDLNRFLIHREIDRADIMGHSMGGKVAMQFALQYPEKTEKLIVADIAPRAYPGGHETIFEALLTANPENAEKRSDIEKHLLKFIPDKSIVLFLMKNLSRSKNGGFRWKANIGALADNYPHILAAIESDRSFKGKSLFLKGGKSHYIDEKSTGEMEKLFPENRLVEIPGAGHWIHAESPVETLRATVEFLGNN